jgi:hypothetical protein
MKRHITIWCDQILKLVNHEAWKELSGTYPEVGTIRIFVIDSLGIEDVNIGRM